MPSLYVSRQGAAIHKEGAQLLVKMGSETISNMRVRSLDRIVIMGNVQMTTQVISLLLSRGIPVSILTRKGEYRGSINPPFGKNNIRRAAQHSLAGNDRFCRIFASSVIEAKIRNGYEFIKRYHRHRKLESMEKYARVSRNMLRKIKGAPGLETLRGIEGFAAKAYFHMLGKIFPPEFGFKGRNKRPPLDPVNSLLSLGYTCLNGEIRSLIEAHGLDPCIGFFHSLEYGRPSLSLDVMEEFRALAIDRFVVYLVKQVIFDAEDFESRDGGCYLKKECLNRFYEEYDRWMQKGMGQGLAHSLRSLAMERIEAVASAIDKGADYQPLLCRDIYAHCSEL